MATNPLGIFQAALANGPHAEPVDVGQVLARNQLAQQQAANLQQSTQEQALKNQVIQRQMQNLNAIHRTLPDLLNKSGGKWDDSVYGGLITAGVDPAEVEKLKGLRLENDESAAKTADLNAAAAESQAKLAEHKRLVAGRMAATLNQGRNADGSYDPVAVEAAISNLEASDPNWKGGGALRQLYAQNPAGFAQKMQSAEASAPEIAAERAKLAAEQAQTEQSKATAGEAAARTKLYEEQAAAARAARVSAEQFMQNPGATLGPGGSIDKLDIPEAAKAALKRQLSVTWALPGMTPQQKAEKVNGEIDKAVQAETELRRQTDPRLLEFDVKKAGRVAEAQNNAFTLTPDAVEMAAQQYRQTGQMPSIARNRAAQKQIMDRAAALGPIDLASNQAAFRANEESLKGLQKNLDSVTAFENTAKKNLDLFLDQAKKVVDSGSPWLNRPLRSIARGGLGSADQAAYDAARQVAINEIAKVTGNPGLTGQLSDTARHEVEAFNPNSATLAQTYKVAQVLKQDMENRRQSYQDQISDIKKRIGGGQTSQPKATHRFNPATGKIEPIP